QKDDVLRVDEFGLGCGCGTFLKPPNIRRGIQPEQPADDGLNGIAAGTAAEIEHQPRMAGESLPRCNRQDLLEQPCLADPSFAAQVHRAASAGLPAGVENAVELGQLGVAANEGATCRGA